jgi:cold-inducible RNA-binding protein
MSMKLYVGGLAYSVKDTDLEAIFTEYGTVSSAKVITDRDSGQSKGFGFVELEDDAAKAAIAALNGKEVSGRALTVNEARPQVDRR